MGLKTSPVQFQRFIEHVLKNFIKIKVLGAYIDDSFIFTNTQFYKLNFWQIKKLIKIN